MTKSKPIQERYRWEAEKTNGEIITTGGDLTACVRVSFIPEVIGLPRHDLTGVRLVRRFGRGFLRVMGNKANEYVHCALCRGFRFYLRSSDGTVLITPVDYELYL